MNTDAIGAVIKVRTGKRSLARVVQSGTSYLSQDDMRQHFGLGLEERVHAIDVYWPDGTKTRLDGVDANQFLPIEQPR